MNNDLSKDFAIKLPSIGRWIFSAALLAAGAQLHAQTNTLASGNVATGTPSAQHPLPLATPAIDQPMSTSGSQVSPKPSPAADDSNATVKKVTAAHLAKMQALREQRKAILNNQPTDLKPGQEEMAMEKLRQQLKANFIQEQKEQQQLQAELRAVNDQHRETNASIPTPVGTGTNP